MKDLAFDSNAAARPDSGIFGLPFSFDESKIVLLPVPWDATASYKDGSSRGPLAILTASRQIDLFDIDLGEFYREGIILLEESKKVRKINALAKGAAKSYLNGNAKKLKIVNQFSKEINQYVYSQVKKILQKNKIVGVLGGEHSVSFGAIKALSELFPEMGVLHFDAHADLRKFFEGFEFSHASIMYNVIEKIKISKLVQIGVRDLCTFESKFIQSNKKILTFFEKDYSEKKLAGKDWISICRDFVQNLPSKIYISFDIDVLDAKLCPNTGTPVPGGLDFNEVCFLIKEIVASGSEIVGFDLTEVASSKQTEWDGNVGARILYKLIGWTLKSQKLI